MNISDCLKKNLRKFRKERGFTQQELADACKLSLATIQLIESGKVWPERETISALARALKIKESSLFIDPSFVPDLEEYLFGVIKWLDRSTPGFLESLSRQLQECQERLVHKTKLAELRNKE